ncbi:MAG TPA: hypothetical protein VIM58_00900, partial [Candidatus Methylacidiphilales bacterium]
MNETLFSIRTSVALFGHVLPVALTITAWKLIGYGGTFIFAGRWVVQLVASRKAGHPVVPLLF